MCPLTLFQGQYVGHHTDSVQTNQLTFIYIGEAIQVIFILWKSRSPFLRQDWHIKPYLIALSTQTLALSFMRANSLHSMHSLLILFP